MKRRTGLTIAFRLLIGMTGTGTSAWFTDMKDLTGRPTDAGTLS